MMTAYINNLPAKAKEPNDPESIQRSFARHLEYSLAITRFNFTMQALSLRNLSKAHGTQL